MKKIKKPYHKDCAITENWDGNFVVCVDTYVYTNYQAKKLSNYILAAQKWCKIKNKKQ